MTHVPLRSSHALGGPGCPYLRPTVYTSEGSREALGLRDCGSGRRDQREHCASSQLYREDAARGRAGAETPGRRPARSQAQGSRASLRGVQACRPGPRGVWHTRPCAQPQRPRVSLRFPHVRIPDGVTGHVADLQTSPPCLGVGLTSPDSSPPPILQSRDRPQAAPSQLHRANSGVMPEAHA